MGNANLDRRGPAEAGRSVKTDPWWLYGVIPWWSGFTIGISLLANHDVPAPTGWGRAGEIALACGLAVSAVCMITALVRRSRRA
jgi:hypothetical protein